ncbi:hypothetical protein Ancab_019393, partial [Ancistrocladus abbreviatus]
VTRGILPLAEDAVARSGQRSHWSSFSLRDAQKPCCNLALKREGNCWVMKERDKVNSGEWWRIMVNNSE